MADGKETEETAGLELAGMSDAQENTSIPQEQAADAQSTEQAMTAVNNDMDSRTSLAGRKRNLQESTHDHTADSDEENDERPRKRVKDHQDPPLVQEQLMTNITSPPIGVSLPSMVEVDQSHQLPASEPSVVRPQDESEKGQTSSPGISPVGNGSVAYEPAPASFGNTQPVATWNSGVSSGLRISFGSKQRASSDPKSAPTGPSGLRDTTQLAAPIEGSAVTSTTNANASVSAPFRELTREEQDNLSGEEKNLYLKSLFAHLKTPAPRQSGTRVTSDPSSYADSSAQDYDDDGIEESPAARELGPAGPFYKLDKAARKRLDPEARAAYDEALLAHQRRKSEYKRQKKAEKAVRDSNKVPPPRTRAQKAADRAASIAAEFEDWVDDDDGKQAELLERQTWRPRGTDLQSPPDKEMGQSDAEGNHGEEENDTNMDTSLDQTGLPQPPPFQKLSKHKRRLLNPVELAAYNRGLHSHKTAERQRAQKEVVPKEVPTKEGKIKRATQDAAAAIARGYPLSDDDINIKKSIADGKTFYPRQLSAVLYSNKAGKWSLPEMFSIDGKPLQIHEFSFNKFAPFFLSQYTNDWHLLNQKALTGAFNTYLQRWYSHLTGTVEFEKSRLTATSNPASFHNAKILAKQLLDHPPSAPVPQAFSQVGGQPQVMSAPPITSDQHPLMPADGAVDMVMEDAADEVASIHDEDMEFIDPTDDEEPIIPELSQVELYLQQKYYPSSDLNVQHCLACSREGHNTLDCPLINCRVCGTSGVHSEAMCPHKKRCQKCRERGHETNNCKEKLSLPKSEMTCDICGTSDHLEMACHYVWRSFDPRPEEILTVREIPVSCYTCGFSDHFGPECGLHRGKIYSGGLTWSKKNLEKYRDPSSRNRALSAGPDYSIPARVPKKGNATDPITVDESDEESSFIRPKVLPTHPKGKIQVQPLKQNQQGPQPSKRQKKKKGPNPEVVDSAYHRNPNPPRASRPEFGPSRPFNNPPQNPPTGPRAGTNNSFGNANRGNANRGGRGRGGGGGGGGLSRADRRRLADQAGARSVLGRF